MENINSENVKMCKCGKHKGHKEIGLFLVLFGFLFLGREMSWLPADFVAVTWPILLIIIGLKKLCSKHRCMCASKN